MRARRACLWAALLGTTVIAWAAGSGRHGPPNPRERLANGGFEEGDLGAASRWTAFERGYAIDGAVARSGSRSARVSAIRPGEEGGASQHVVLSQPEPRPLRVSGWSRAEGVSGQPDSDYALYVDLWHADGTPLWAQTARFDTGTHGWQRREVLILPAKPIRELRLHALLRRHTGTAWFDDISLEELTPEEVFDGQAIPAPRLASGARSGWFVRDVAARSPLVPLGGESRLGLRLERLPAMGPLETVRATDLTGRDRAITLYWVERFDARRPVWWEDARRSVPATGTLERANLVQMGAGATGYQSLYPFGCVTGEGAGRLLGAPPLEGPRILRIGLHAPTRILYAAFDVALTGRCLAWRDARGRGRAQASVVHAEVDPAWGFRSAIEKWQRLFPEAHDRRATRHGLWIAFTDPATVPRHEDFGFAFHEGDNSVASDDRLGILSFRYTEPMTWWMAMPPEMPRAYDAAIALARRHAEGADSAQRAWGQALLASGAKGPDGRFRVEFHEAPWTRGAVWVLNPNPRLPVPPGGATKGSLSYTRQMGDRLYGSGSRGTLDGEYLDSIEGWAEHLDYREESLRHSGLPPAFTVDTRRPVIPTWFSVWELAAEMRRDLRRRGRLLMANGTPWRIHWFLPLLDLAGTETSWLPGGRWQPDSDAVFLLRRTLAGPKPYLLLQNTDFDAFGPALVEKYFQRSLFYGVLPSMFSVDASSHPYWTEPRWFERDRALFRRYVPAIRVLSETGWAPVTHARSSNPRVYVERFGRNLVTVLNDSREPVRATVAVDPRALGWKGKGSAWAVDLVSGAKVPVSLTGAAARMQVELGAEEGRAFRLTGPPR